MLTARLKTAPRTVVRKNRDEARSGRPIMVAISLDDLAHLPCRACRATLNIHQPDPDSPDRLLGTCGQCGTWFLIEIEPGNAGARMVPLSEVRPFTTPSESA